MELVRIFYAVSVGVEIGDGTMLQVRLEHVMN